jgi:GTP-binding protein
MELDFMDNPELPFEVKKSDTEEGVYIIEGPRIERMLGYTNLESEKGFDFFQKFLKNNGILDQLEALGINEGDMVRMYALEFDYYK